MNIIAFDPGLKGAITIYQNGKVAAHPMSIAGKVLDLSTLAAVFLPLGLGMSKFKGYYLAWGYPSSWSLPIMESLTLYV
jgi:hypothetical protein